MSYREYEARKILRRVSMAYGVDRFPNPTERASGHMEYDYNADLGRSVGVWVEDFDDDGEAVDE